MRTICARRWRGLGRSCTWPPSRSSGMARLRADQCRGDAIVVRAAEAAGVERFVHMSQNGSDSRSPYRFLRSKGVAQDIVTGSKLRWTVLRPSVIVGREDAFVNVLARLVRLTPLVFPLPGGGTARFQPVFVSDVARVARLALEKETAIGAMYALGGPVPLTLRQWYSGFSRRCRRGARWLRCQWV